jgi:outer membrane protein assembly factor BamB
MKVFRYILVVLVAAGLTLALWKLSRQHDPSAKPVPEARDDSVDVNAAIGPPKAAKHRPFTAPASGPIKLALGSTPWPMYRGDPRMSGCAGGRIGNSPRLAWVVRTGEKIREGSDRRSSAVIGHGLAYIGAPDGKLYALELATGRQAWAYPTGDVIQAPPMLLDDAVIFGGGDRKVYCLGALDGKLRWTLKTESDIVASPNWLAGPGGAKRVVVGSWDNNLYCADFKSGQQLWKSRIGGYVNASATVDRGNLFLGGCDCILYRVNGDNGDMKRMIETPQFIASAPAMSEGKLYLGDYDGTLYCVDAASGKVDWTYKVESPIDAGVAVTDDRVVFASLDHRVYCLDLLGRKLWEFRGRDEFFAPPVICGDRVIAPCDDGWLYLLDLADGKEVWSFELGAQIRSSPAVGGGFVVVGCDDGCIYGFAVENKTEK